MSTQVARRVIDGVNYFDVTPFRERFLELRSRGESIKTMAERGNMHPDQLPRACGVRECVQSRNKVTGTRGGRLRIHTVMVRYDTAVKLCKCLKLDPWEVGV